MEADGSKEAFSCASPARLAALRGYGILDTPPEVQFDEITRLIAHVCEVPVALISFVDADRQWFKSHLGLALEETPLDHSICAHAIRQDGLFLVPDLSKDARFARSPVVTGGDGFRFYAGAPLKTPEGELLGTLCILDRKPRELTDYQKATLTMLASHVMTILQLRRQTRLLEEARDREEKASRAKDHFLSLLSHELRAPLTPMTLSTSVLLGDASLDPKQREAVELINRNMKLQVRLIDDLLDFTRLERQRIKLEQTPVNLADLLRDTIKTIKRHIETPSIKCVSSAKRESVSGDRARLKQIFRAILHNAVKFTPIAGHVTVEITDLSDEMVRVRVTDTGVGISDATLKRVFEPFEQGSDFPPAQRVAGLGLGLALAKGLTELHGGQIVASSAGYQKGATFTVDLPSVKTEPVSEITTSTEPTSSLISLRILLVEDQGATAVSLTRLLFRAGHQVLIAGSLAGAREIADREYFDVLISDIGLPDGSGYDLMRELKERGFHHGIALSGHGSQEDREASFAAGFSQHLTKPVDYSEVEFALNRVMQEMIREGNPALQTSANS